MTCGSRMITIHPSIHPLPHPFSIITYLMLLIHGDAGGCSRKQKPGHLNVHTHTLHSAILVIAIGIISANMASHRLWPVSVLSCSLMCSVLFLAPKVTSWVFVCSSNLQSIYKWLYKSSRRAEILVACHPAVVSLGLLKTGLSLWSEQVCSERGCRSLPLPSFSTLVIIADWMEGKTFIYTVPFLKGFTQIVHLFLEACCGTC